MSKFDEVYDIRQAKYEEIPEIMDFYNTYWKKGHILGTNREFFEYEFITRGKKEVNFLIAKNRQTGEIEAAIGYMFASLDFKDGWGACWKVRDDVPVMPFLGVEIHKRLLNMGFRFFPLIGANPNTAIKLFKNIFKYTAHKMKHYYRLNANFDYRIAKIKKKIIIPKDSTIEQCMPNRVYNIEELKKYFDFSLLKDTIPYKDEWYYNHRFFNHPIYKYIVYVLKKSFFVAREQEILLGGGKKYKILRIVDFAGEQKEFENTWDFFDKLIKENNYEYVDFYNYGMDEQALKNAGFVLKEENSVNIIPNYFYPFIQENIDIYIAENNDKTVFFKADGDQDRPN